jgi:hypothetical protein
VNAPFFQDADLLIAADCTAYAYGKIHEEFIKDRITLIGCTKLDDIDYSQKLTEIFKNNKFRSVTVLRMEVPCCGGMEYVVKQSLENADADCELKVVNIGINGMILNEE